MKWQSQGYETKEIEPIATTFAVFGYLAGCVLLGVLIAGGF